MTDTERLDKLERMNRTEIRSLHKCCKFRGYCLTENGHLRIVSPWHKLAPAEIYKSLREAIDAAPEPKRR